MKGREKKFLGPDRIELFTDNGRDLQNRPLTQGEVGVNAGGELPDKAGSDEELMRGKIRIRRIIPQSGHKGIAPAHRTHLEKYRASILGEPETESSRKGKSAYDKLVRTLGPKWPTHIFVVRSG